MQLYSIVAHMACGPSSSIKEAMKYYVYHNDRISTKSAYHHLRCTPVGYVRLEYSPSCLVPQSFVPNTNIDPKNIAQSQHSTGSQYANSQVEDR